MDVVDKIIAYESGEMSDNAVIEFFAELIKSGDCWKWQGSYGRAAAHLIESGYISKAGEVLQLVWAETGIKKIENSYNPLLGTIGGW